MTDPCKEPKTDGAERHSGPSGVQTCSHWKNFLWTKHTTKWAEMLKGFFLDNYPPEHLKSKQ